MDITQEQKAAVMAAIEAEMSKQRAAVMQGKQPEPINVVQIMQNQGIKAGIDPNGQLMVNGQKTEVGNDLMKFQGHVTMTAAQLQPEVNSKMEALKERAREQEAINQQQAKPIEQTQGKGI